MSVQSQINSLVEITNLQALTQSLTQTLSTLNEGIPSGVVTSGLYTPSITDIDGGSTITVLGDGLWQNIGGIVNATFLVRIELAGNTELFYFDMPVVPANDFADSYAVLSSWSTRTPTDEYSEIAIQAESTTKTAAVSITAPSAANIDLVINFTYNADN